MFIECSVVMMLPCDFCQYVLIACDYGTYGQRCDKRCGYCLNKAYCFHTNGTCLNGCDPGYKGNLCNACMLILFSSTKWFKMLLDLTLISMDECFAF